MIISYKIPLKIYGAKGSTSEEWAKKHDVDFIEQ